VSAIAVTSLIDVPFDAWSDPTQADPLRLAISILAYATMGLAPWFICPASILGALALALILVLGSGIGVAPFVIMPCVIAMVIRTLRWQLWVTIGVCFAWTITLALLMDDINVALVYGAVIFISVSIGTGIRYVVVDRHKASQRITELKAANRRVHIEQRELLARELHDVVAHELSLICLQSLAHGESEDAVELREALRRSTNSARTALTQLRTLVGVLREVDADGEPVNDPAALLASDLTALRIQETLDKVVSSLRESGFSPDVQVELDPTPICSCVHTTVARVLSEAATNILRHAQPRSRCLLSMRATVDHIHVHIVSEMIPQPTSHLADDPNGWGLRGLKERVDLCGGRFEAGPVVGHWVVDAVLPNPQNESECCD
jgi:signal transduction histidine kinase